MQNNHPTHKNATKNATMRYNPELHHRHSIRFKGYDYSSVGAYFITLCTQSNIRLFGNIIDGQLQLNQVGQMVTMWHNKLEHKFPDIRCDAFVCMPNHLHFIVVNTGKPKSPSPVGADLRVCPGTQTVPSMRKEAQHTASLPQTLPIPAPGQNSNSPLQKVVQWFKTMTTNDYIRGVKHKNWPPFKRKLWHRNYYEHIIRNDHDLNLIREYIANNPLLWQEDSYYAQ
jgi:putative transposase